MTFTRTFYMGPSSNEWEVIENEKPKLEAVPHLVLIALIEEKDGPVTKMVSPMLDLWEDILRGFWDLEKKPLAIYCTQYHNRLIVCEDGVYEVDETREYIRFRGSNEILEEHEWILTDPVDSDDENKRVEEYDPYRPDVYKR
ncbi:hypothetical protein BJ508DRAFT_309327 [Ascobolus immersus RN42]|uniref:Uncharacterized protein n=1 Tax=Ascobolus immersus RN42 TaxID=1160509 RepID=A0A3N4HYY3_ASCIM|nr:hypothetical protein BJ508DRAFT_309327 [Ascobolus immersus RN42]